MKKNQNHSGRTGITFSGTGRALVAAIALAVTTPLALAQSSPTPGATEPNKYNWELDRTDGPCKSYTSTVASKPYIAAKAVCDTPARIEVLATILRDVEGFSEWMADCEASKLLKVENDDKDVMVFWLHQHISILKDRDMVLRSTVSRDYTKGVHLIEARSTEDIKHESGKSAVRMPSFYAQYQLEWIDREHTRVTYLIDPDLGPGLPKSIANSTIRKIPLHSLEGMMKIAKDKKYVEMAKTSKYAREVDAALKQGLLK